MFLPSDGPAQLATGALITFLFLLLNLTCRPFCTPGFNNLQSFSLISQFLTLFCGIFAFFRVRIAFGCCWCCCCCCWCCRRCEYSYHDLF